MLLQAELRDDSSQITHTQILNPIGSGLFETPFGIKKNRKKDTGEDLFTGYKFPSTLGVKHSNSTEYNKKN